MNRRALCLIALWTLGAGTVYAQEAVETSAFELGTHYRRLTPTQPTSSSPDKVEVAEIFWYGCPHCNDLEPILESWNETKPDYVNFVRIPGVWNPLVRLHAQIYYTAVALEKIDEMHADIFRAIHVEGNPLDTEAAIARLFERHGVSDEEFKAAFESFEVHSRLERADELARRYRITSVPTLVVNGKYTSDAVMTGSYQSLLELVDELAAAENAGD